MQVCVAIGPATSLGTFDESLESGTTLFSPLFFLLRTICELQLGGFKFPATLSQHC